ncbi:transcriptional regulator with XRE-family HTH domain [Actinokineospora baliensis]|uniref:XRE family transcriptional regulator n=1 Tax=Actinokineospora baliensis TaxID=547056 RepID=UPI00195BAC01|nr:XRE family transcriptional regulator [Actinokineospora baliensis]MBM7774274.1 transcriptional regulator with XRE-family HTH domain [Actinokineospora baliensis]
MSPTPVDWPAVARCITERLTELGLTQRELALRSQVSQAIIRELQYNTLQRNRSTRTLQALSTTLELHPHHLTQLLHGHTPPPPHTDPEPEDPVAQRLAAIEHRMVEMAETLDQFRVDLAMILHNTRRA